MTTIKSSLIQESIPLLGFLAFHGRVMLIHQLAALAEKSGGRDCQISCGSRKTAGFLAF
ncbi:MAG: hypothetical protein WCJ35_19585 [Planctomycetota bacterium]